MPTEQIPIESEFGYRSTAKEVVAGADLRGKLVVITGGYSGLGLETTRAFAGAGANVIVPARRPDHAKAELAGIKGNVEVDELDLGDQASVEAFATRFLESGRSIDILINNAAVMACPEARVGPGWESQFGINHLGHYALVNRLWPALKAGGGGARVVSLSSTGHKLSPIRFDDPQFETSLYEKWVAYGQAKTANSLFAVGLDARGQKDGVRAFAVHPGGIMTPLQRHLPKEEMIAAGWMDEDGKVNELFKSPEEGASTTCWAATSPMLDGMGGVYCEDCNIAAAITDTPNRYGGVDAHATDKGDADKLWALSAELTGVDAFG